MLIRAEFFEIAGELFHAMACASQHHREGALQARMNFGYYVIDAGRQPGSSLLRCFGCRCGGREFWKRGRERPGLHDDEESLDVVARLNLDILAQRQEPG